MKNYFYVLRVLIVGIVSLQMVSCGTLMYPERRGQKAGQLDVGIVVLDAIGLLFGLIPGIIAFAVDFSSGAIYLPTSKSGMHGGKYRIVKFDPGHYTNESLEAMISKETGLDFHFNDKRIQYIKLKNADEVSLHFAQFEENARPELSLAAGQ